MCVDLSAGNKSSALNLKPHRSKFFLDEIRYGSPLPYGVPFFVRIGLNGLLDNLFLVIRQF